MGSIAMSSQHQREPEVAELHFFHSVLLSLIFHLFRPLPNISLRILQEYAELGQELQGLHGMARALLLEPHGR